MAVETKDIPEIAKTAFAQLNTQVQDEVARLARQTLDVMGLDPKDGWRFDAATFTVTRTTPEEK